MSNSRYDAQLSLSAGITVGILAGFVAGILLAPKSGEELRNDMKRFVTDLPEEVSTGINRSKTQYQDLVDKTRGNIENQIEERATRKRASRMAEAKLKEERETGYSDF